MASELSVFDRFRKDLQQLGIKLGLVDSFNLRYLKFCSAIISIAPMNIVIRTKVTTFRFQRSDLRFRDYLYKK